VPRKPRWVRSGKLLYLFLIPLFVSVVIALVSGEYGHFIKNGIGFALLLTTAAATAKGIAQEAAYHATVITRAPKVPYKTLAMILLGITVVYLAFVAGSKPLLPSLFVGLLASAGYGLYYGLDPRRDKLPDMGDINPELVLQTLSDAQAKLTEAAKLPGLDGRKMSKSYGNSIYLSEDMDSITKKVMSMLTDTNRKRKKDPGDPDVCNLYPYHRLMTPEDIRAEIKENCTNAKWGCVDCKKVLLKYLQEFLEPIQKRRQEIDKNPDMVAEILNKGNAEARAVAQENMKLIREKLKRGKEKN